MVQHLAGPAGVDLASLSLPLAAETLFGSARPLEVEIGSGNGRFLQEWARAHPEIGLLGVERARKYAERGALRVVKHDLANVRMLFTTAEDLLFRCLAPASVDGFHVYFPDPWPKKRHNKRRFFRADNVARLAVVLKPGCLLRVKTDHVHYAVAIAEVLAAEPCLELLDPEQGFAGVPPTAYELKYAVEGRPIQRWAFRHVSRAEAAEPFSSLVSGGDRDLSR